MLTSEEIEALNKPYLPGAERAFDECMAGYRHQEEVFKGLEQKALLLFSVLVTILSGLVALAIAARAVVHLAAIGAAAVVSAVAMYCALEALRTRAFHPPFTDASHWVRKETVAGASDLAKTMLHLASFTEGWIAMNQKGLDKKADWIDRAITCTALAPVAAALAALASAFWPVR